MKFVLPALLLALSACDETSTQSVTKDKVAVSATAAREVAVSAAAAKKATVSAAPAQRTSRGTSSQRVGNTTFIFGSID